MLRHVGECLKRLAARRDEHHRHRADPRYGEKAREWVIGLLVDDERRGRERRMSGEQQRVAVGPGAGDACSADDARSTCPVLDHDRCREGAVQDIGELPCQQIEAIARRVRHHQRDGLRRIALCAHARWENRQNERNCAENAKQLRHGGPRGGGGGRRKLRSGTCLGGLV